MKTLFTRLAVCFFVFFISINISYAQQFEWVKGGGSAYDFGSSPSHDWEQVKFMCTDPNGNVYALSQVGNDPITADTFHGTPYGGVSNVLLTSYNCNGVMRWAKLIASSDANCYPTGIITDSLGNVYIAGSFHGAGGGSTLYIGEDTTLSASSTENLTTGLIQYDTSGHFHWIRYVGPNTYAGLATVSTGHEAIDSSNNLHYFCYIAGTGTLLMPGVTSVYGTYDMEYNPSGTLLSATRLQLDSSLFPTGATIDRESNKSYVYGDRNYSDIDFLDSSAYNFVAAFDPAGNNIWIDTLGDPGSTSEEEGLFSGVTADGMGHLYLLGGGYNILNYMGDTIRYPSYAMGGTISFIMKADTAGHMEWATQCDGNLGGGLIGITLVPGNKIAAVGGFVGLVNSDGLHNTLTAGTGPQSQPFYMIVDTSGALISFNQIHGDGGNNYGVAITADRTGNIYFGGWVSDTIPDTLITSYHSIGGNTDFYIVKYGVDCDCTSYPVANYTAVGTHTVDFTYTGTTIPTIDSVKWSFGDGDSSTTTNPVHVYTANGIYTACVSVFSACGNDLHCSDIIICATTPVSSYTYTGTPDVHFTYTGSTAVIDSVVWQLGDGTTVNTISPTHTFTATGTYSVCATVYSPCGDATFCNTVNIPCIAPPTASYSYVLTGPSASFTYTGTTTGIDSVRWHFGDGGTSTVIDPSYTYSAVGTYSACVTVYTACGSNTYCQDITIPCVTAPIASYTSVVSAPSVSFTYTGTTAAIDSVRWEFGDGGTSTATSPSYSYTATGTYSVCVTAYSACGSYTYCNNVIINCITPPSASFTDTGTTAAISFTYTGTSTGIDAISWDFGDGGTSTATNPLYNYTIPGTYTVCVTAYSDCGTNTYCNTVVVTCVGTPIASFTDTGTSVIGFTYTGTTDGLDSVIWSYGDGTTDTGLAPTHAYATTDTYQVCVTVYTDCGMDSSCSTVVIAPTGIASLSLSNVQVYPNPTDNELYITGILQNTNYRLLSVTGECMQQGTLVYGSNTLAMKSFTPGIYILEMTGVNGIRNMVRVVKD